MPGTSRATRVAVDGATIYAERRGSPSHSALLLIAGGNTDAGVFDDLADYLSASFHVITCDPRGNSRSPVDDRSMAQSIELHAMDMVQVLEDLDVAPAVVFGTSSGGLVGLAMLTDYSDRVQFLVTHEPPAVGLLPDSAHWQGVFRRIRETFETSGARDAMLEFLEAAGIQPPPATDLPPQLGEKMARWDANAPFFLQREICEFSSYVPRIAALKDRTGQLVVLAGRASRGQLPYRTSQALATELGLNLEEIVGDHGGYLSDPQEFGARLEELIRARIASD